MHGSFTKRSQRTTYIRRIFLQQLAEDLSGPYIDERSNIKKRRLQEETFDEGHGKLTKYCQVKDEIGLCVKCSSSQQLESFFGILGFVRVFVLLVCYLSLPITIINRKIS